MAPLRRRRASSRFTAAVASSELTRPLAGGNARVSPEVSSAEEDEEEEAEGRWSALVPELLSDILRRVHDGAERWPRRRDVVACACVCRRWREASAALVRPPIEGGGITFLSSLKQPGPRDAPIRCFIKRNRANSAFYLYLNLTQALKDEGKFLLAAHRIGCGLYLKYVISVQSDDCYHGNYVGKLKSNLMRTKLFIYEQRPRHEGLKAPNSRSGRLAASTQLSPHISHGDVETGEVSYKYNLLKSRGPRRIQCRIQYLAHEAAIDPTEATQTFRPKLFLTNKTPRWHELLHCWCLDFNRRVMVASVKNFQLISPMRLDVSWGDEDSEMVILQFGKVEDDVFTMDYRWPLSAFQAFAICITSFGSKLSRHSGSS